MEELQKCLRESVVNYLKENIINGDSRDRYINKEPFEFKDKDIIKLANIYKPQGLDKKMMKAETDYHAAIVLYEAYPNLTPVLASYEPFWTYLTHIDLYEYTSKRRQWTKESSTDSMIDYWCFGSAPLFRNAVANLWWSVYRTVDEERDDKYEITKLFFRNATMRTRTLGTSLFSRNKEALIGILEFVDEYIDEFQVSLEIIIRFIATFFNRLGAIKELSYFDRYDYRSYCEKIKPNLLKITMLDDLKNSQLYSG